VRKEGAMQQIILLLQENALKAAVVQKLLTQSNGKHFDIEWIRSRDAALKRLKDRTKANIAAILVDLRLPDSQQLKIFDRIFEAAPHAPILMLGCRGCQ
jgi:DNA-binding response OmpR family regulator